MYPALARPFLWRLGCMGLMILSEAFREGTVLRDSELQEGPRQGCHAQGVWRRFTTTCATSRSFKEDERSRQHVEGRV